MPKGRSHRASHSGMTWSNRPLRPDPKHANPFMRHEALHTTYILLDSVSRHLAEHPYIVANQTFADRTAQISDALAALYQAIGEASVD